MKLSESELRKIIQNELVIESSLDKVTIPGNIKKIMGKFLNSIQDAKLSRVRQMHILQQVLRGLHISSKDLMVYIQKVKQDLDT